jgi:eukaryotic-like serine/threonine-protein kinase
VSDLGRIGQYRILRELGAGGMGTVFLGEHLLLKRLAAIKALRPSLSAHHGVVERFFNEARATSAITDPGIVQIFDFGYHVDGTAFIVMEYLDGESLADRIDRRGRLRVDEALRMARQIAVSVSVAHAHGIVHRDLKPENVFIIRDPEAQGGERTKVLDFGICKRGDGDAMVTQTGEVLGTPVYASPEQCRGQKDVDLRADIYSLGCVLFHMVTGRVPFMMEGIGEFIAAHLREQPPFASEFADVPPRVDATIAKCLAKAPDDRFQTMEELVVAIDAALDEDLLDGPAPTIIMNVVPFTPAPVTPAPVTPPPTTPAPQGVEPAAKWFVSTPIPVPKATTTGHTSGEMSIANRKPKRSGARVLAALLLLVAVVGAGVVTFMGIRDDVSNAEAVALDPANAVAAPEPAPAPAPAPAPEPEPAPAPVPVPVAGSEPPPVEPAAAPAPAPAPKVAKATVERAKPATKPRAKRKARSKAKRPTVTAVQSIAKPKPKPVPTTNQKPTPKQSTPEDLYDTR